MVTFAVRNEEDRIMLGEMTALVTASTDYQKLAETVPSSRE
ncbi:hypothetical protein G159_18760 [Planococcus glaciei CHR43]|nr:hypothetical protein [Planococcus glaciei]ETP67187.1 hypothetical protein G159_18760 [Planococcus glaciei CHR43]